MIHIFQTEVLLELRCNQSKKNWLTSSKEVKYFEKTKVENKKEATENQYINNRGKKREEKKNTTTDGYVKSKLFSFSFLFNEENSPYISGSFP